MSIQAKMVTNGDEASVNSSVVQPAHHSGHQGLSSSKLTHSLPPNSSDDHGLNTAEANDLALLSQEQARSSGHKSVADCAKTRNNRNSTSELPAAEENWPFLGPELSPNGLFIEHASMDDGPLGGQQGSYRSLPIRTCDISESSARYASPYVPRSHQLNIDQGVSSDTERYHTSPLRTGFSSEPISGRALKELDQPCTEPTDTERIHADTCEPELNNAENIHSSPEQRHSAMADGFSSGVKPVPPFVPTSLAMQDYHMQLKSLERQNRRRLEQAKVEHQGNIPDEQPEDASAPGADQDLRSRASMQSNGVSCEGQRPLPSGWQSSLNPSLYPRPFVPAVPFTPCLPPSVASAWSKLAGRSGIPTQMPRSYCPMPSPGRQILRGPGPPLIPQLLPPQAQVSVPYALPPWPAHGPAYPPSVAHTPMNAAQQIPLAPAGPYTVPNPRRHVYDEIADSDSESANPRARRRRVRYERSPSPVRLPRGNMSDDCFENLCRLTKLVKRFPGDNKEALVHIRAANRSFGRRLQKNSQMEQLLARAKLRVQYLEDAVGRISRDTEDVQHQLRRSVNSAEDHLNDDLWHDWEMDIQALCKKIENWKKRCAWREQDELRRFGMSLQNAAINPDCQEDIGIAINQSETNFQDDATDDDMNDDTIERDHEDGWTSVYEK